MSSTGTGNLTSGHATFGGTIATMTDHAVGVEAGGSPTLAAHCAAWLAFQRGQVQPSTLESYRYQLQRYVLGRLGELRLDELTPGLLTRTWAELLSNGGRDGGRLGLRTVKHAHDVVRNALEWAVGQGYLEVNPAATARPPRVDPDRDSAEGPFRVWTGAQAAAFLDLSRDHRLHLVFLLALSTGMRRGEILGLRWEDVDLARGELHVRRAVAVAGDRLLLKRPKTGRSRRIRIDPRLVAALELRRQRQVLHRVVAGQAWADRWGLVVTTQHGAALHPSRVSAAFARLLRGLDLPRIRFHDCRHTHASLLLQAGVAPHVVAQRLGHAKPAMTLNVYAHVLPAADRQAVELFAAAVYGARAAEVQPPTG